MAPTICSPGSNRMVMGPCANRPIKGSESSVTRSRSRRPMSLISISVPSSRQITALLSSTPSFNLRTLVARPDRSTTSLRGSRLKRPSLLSKPRLNASMFWLGNDSSETIVSPSRPVGRKRSTGPGCCPANSQRTWAMRPLALTASSRGGGSIGKITCAGDGASPMGQGSLRCSRPST